MGKGLTLIPCGSLGLRRTEGQEESSATVPAAESLSESVKSVPDDARLVRAAQAGEAEAFGALYDRYLPDVARFLSGLGLPLGREEVDDLVQETFLRCYRGLGGFDAERPLRPYLLSIARNTALGVLRSRRRRPEAPDATAVAEQAHPETTSDRLRLRERARLVAESLAALEPELRTALVLRHVNGLTMKELEACLGCSAPTARARVRDAGRRLALELRRRGLVPAEACA